MRMTRDPILYIDCTSTIRSGLKTGVQRVVYNIAALKSELEKLVKIKCTAICYCNDNFYEVESLENDQDAEISKSKTIDFIYKDIYFCPDAFWTFNIYKWLPYMKDRGVSIVVIMYDLIPLLYPTYVDAKSVSIFSEAIDVIVKTSDLIMCISDETKRDLLGAYQVSELGNKCKVIKLGPGLNDNKQKSIHPRLPDSEFFLMVGTIENRRGYVEVIDCLREMREEEDIGYKLVIVGKKGFIDDNKLQRIEDNSLFVEWISDMNDEELLYAYKKAKAVICASKAEGFGLSVLEGLIHNGIVLANKLAVFGEFAGSYPYYFDIDDLDSLKYLVRKIGKLKRYSYNADGYNWSLTIEQIATYISDITRVHCRLRHIEVSGKTEESVRWIYWLLLNRAASPDEINYWLGIIDMDNIDIVNYILKNRLT